jgi:hypothetical protein
MRTAPAAALSVALLAWTGCGGKKADPPPGATPEAPRGACVGSPTHQLCGGTVTAGEATVGFGNHRVAGSVGDGARRLSSSQHRVDGGTVSP